MQSDPRARTPAPLEHGGDLDLARRLFPGAPEPFIDLSTGINPISYPLQALVPESFIRLPESAALDHLGAVAAACYGAPSTACVVAAPGTQILLPMVAGLVRPGRAGILGPTYAEYARAAAVAGHEVLETTSLDALSDVDLAILAQPNNPDGRLLGREALLGLAEAITRRGGLLLVDEAYMDVAPPGASFAPEVENAGVVVLRSFGKFYGLPGLRLGFALLAPRRATLLRARLGPWAVSGPALAIGLAALGDTGWATATRVDLVSAAIRLDSLLWSSGLEVLGGTNLFRLTESSDAAALFEHLGRAGIFVRRFREQPTWLRFGLPGPHDAWDRVRLALGSFGV